MLDADSIPNGVSDGARTAIVNHVHRVNRAVAAGDVEQIIGAAKDLVECVTKVAIETLGGTYGSNEKLPKLAQQALSALKSHPSGFQGRRPLQEFTQALAKVPAAVAELRNHDGTGHGRTQPTDLHEDTAAFVQQVAVAWSRWVLAALGRVLTGMSELDEAIRAIEWDVAFRRGELRSFLDELHLDQLESEQQRRLGVAVGRRWASGTFMVRLDVIEPFVAGESFPEPFAVGLIEGSFIDTNGYIRTNGQCAHDAAVVAAYLGEVGADTLTELAEKMESAEFSYAFEDEEYWLIVEALRRIAGTTANDRLRQALLRMAERIDVDTADEYEE
jgi:hypothetical protein